MPDAAGQGLDFDQLVFRVVPAMIAFHIGPHEETGNHFAFAFLSRYDSDFDLGYSDVDVSGLKPDASAGFGRYKQRVLEYWLGGTWSRRLSRDVSVGLSPFLAYRAQRSRRSLAVEELAPDLAARGVRRHRERVQPRARCWPSSASPGGPAPGSSAPR